jgi:Peptidase_C39 like family
MEPRKIGIALKAGHQILRRKTSQYLLRFAGFGSNTLWMRVDPEAAADLRRRDQPGKVSPSKVRMVAPVALFIVLGVALLYYYYGVPRRIPSAGGFYFFSRLELPVHRFAQADPRWSADHLGLSAGTMGEEGCAVSSSAMVLAFYGQKVDPGLLNAFLTMNGGYTPEGWLYWERAADFMPGMVRHAYEDLPSYLLIDSNLLRGNPVIVRIRLPTGITHFVVIVGKTGFDYLIQDPALGGESGVYPLRNLAREIDALRFYERVRKE